MGLRTIGCVLVALPALAGCAEVGPDFLRPAAPVSPRYKEFKGWKLATPADGAARGEWWKAFGDPELDRLEQRVEVSNETVKVDEANYQQALALIAEARAGLWPTLNFNPALSRSSGAGDQLNAQITAAWTLDIWGKAKRQIEQQEASAEQSQANLANATLAARSALALAFVQLRQADASHALLTRTTDDYKRALNIAQNQYDAGTAAKSDVITAKAQLLGSEAQDINIGVVRATSEHAIAILIWTTAGLN